MASRIKERAQHVSQVLGQLNAQEIFWKDRYDWLSSCGYQLRPRYKPDWTPSWEKNHEHPLLCEDSKTLNHPGLIDAIRMSDDTQVVLKRIEESEHPFEAEISTYFSKEPLASDPRNHCIPVLDVLHSPDLEHVTILVMPLARDYCDPEFDTFGEAIDFMRQIIEGLQFMHEHHVAHRDIKTTNILMDAKALYPGGFHFMRPDLTRDYKDDLEATSTRTGRPPKYYLIDYGISRQYDPKIGPPLEAPIIGGDRTVPEFKPPWEPQNPFPTDIYYLGNTLRTDFLDGNPLMTTRNGRRGFEFLRPLVADMIQDDPTKRPTIDEVASTFEGIVKTLGGWKLRSRVVPRDQGVLQRVTDDASHWVRRIRFVIARVPSVPKYNPELSA